MGVWETRGSSAREEAKSGSGMEPAKAYRALKRDAVERNCLRVNGAIEFIRESPGEKVRRGPGNSLTEEKWSGEGRGRRERRTKLPVTRARFEWQQTERIRDNDKGGARR